VAVIVAFMQSVAAAYELCADNDPTGTLYHMGTPSTSLTPSEMPRETGSNQPISEERSET